MSRSFLVSLCGLGLVIAVSVANAALDIKGAAVLRTGENILAGSAHNDSPGSSDLTLIVQLTIDGKVVVEEGTACKAIQAKQNLPSDADPTGWTKPGFDDSSWQDAKYGVGYGDNDDNTVIGDGQNATVYTRARFTVANASAVTKVVLGVDYDDAAVIYINGIEVARTAGTGIPPVARFDSWSDAGTGQSHEASKKDPPVYETVELKVEAAAAVSPKGRLATSWAALKSGR
jgi:hypothetical protein